MRPSPLSQSARWRHLLALLLVVVVGSVIACSETVTAPVQVKEVVVGGAVAPMRLGQSGQLSVTLKGEGGVTLPAVGVTWTSSAPDIVTVDNAGRISAVKRGVATVTASAGAANGTASVQVLGVKSVDARPDSVTLIVTQGRQLTAIVDSDAGVTVTTAWTVRDTTLARITPDGVITARSAIGVTWAIASAEDQRDSVKVRVVPVPVAKVTVSPATETIIAGQSLQLAAVTADSAENVLTGRAITWSSSDTALATVSATGLVSARAAGAVTISATSEGKVGSSTITILPPVARVDVTPDTLDVILSQSRPLAVKTFAASGAELTGRQVTWASLDTTIARVSTAGAVTGRALGVTRVTATAEGKVDTAVVRVVRVPVAEVVVNPSDTTVAAGRTLTLVATTKDSLGAVLSGRTIVWSSLDTTKATVTASGVVTVKATAVGTVEIRATSEGRSGTARISVLAQVATVELSPSTVSLQIGQSRSITATPRDVQGNALTGRSIAWASTDTAIVRVSTSGVITARALGTTTITATAEGKVGLLEVTVVPPPVATVTVSPATVSVIIGQTVALSAITRLADGTIVTGRTVTWSVSDTALARISATGVVTGRAQGEVVVRATSEGKTGEAAVTVLPPVSRVTLSPTSMDVYVGQTRRLSATMFDASETVLLGRVATWSTLDEAVATVSTQGEVRGVAPGTTTIRVLSEGKLAEATIRVLRVPVISVTVSPTALSLQTGQATTLTATPKDSVGGALTNREVVWSTDNASIAQVTTDGLVTARGEGLALITATVEGKTATVAVTVTLAPPSVDRVRIQSDTVRVIRGGTTTAVALPQDATGNTLVGRTVTWSVADTTIARVSSTGVVSGLALGSTTLSATSEGKTGTAVLRVVPVPVATISVIPDALLLVEGQSSQLAITAKDSTGAVLTGRSATYASSDSLTARVTSTGLVTARQVGTAIVRVTSEGISADVPVTVTAAPPPVARVLVAPDTLRIIQGQALPITALPEDAAGNVLVGRTVTWSSANQAVATVSTAGVVTAVTVGTTTVSATVEGKTGSTVVIVRAVPVGIVSVVPEAVLLTVGQTSQLVTTTRDSTGATLTGRVVTYASSDTTIAVVSAAGLITARVIGTAVVTVASEGKTKEVPVTVAAAPPTVATVAVAPDTLVVVRGTARPLTALPKDASGNVLSGRTISWVTANATIATISSTGLVTGVALGQTTATATVDGKSASAVVRVVAVPVASVTVTPELSTLVEGQTAQLVAALKDSTGAVLTGRSVAWRSTDTTKATVGSSGMVRAILVGSTSIIATSEGISDTVTVNVTGAPPKVVAVVITPDSVTTRPGRTVPLTVALRDTSGADLVGRTVVWRSSDSTVARVTGGIVAVEAYAGTETRTARISATSEGVADTVLVTVLPLIPAVVDLQPSGVTLPVGQTLQMSALVKDSAGVTLSGRTVSFVSSSTSVATISSSGLLTAVSAGSTTITASAEGLSATSTITVAAGTVEPGIVARLKGPAGTGYFLVETSGGTLASPEWTRVTQVTGDSARVTLPLKAGSGYRLRAFAIDVRTNPVLSNQVLLSGVGEVSEITVAPGTQTTLLARAPRVALAIASAKDTVAAFEPMNVQFDVTDSSGVISDAFPERFLQYSTTGWGSDQEGRDRVNATFLDRVQGAYRYGAAIPEQSSAGVLFWQVQTAMNVNGPGWSNRLALASPSLSVGEALRRLTVTASGQRFALTLKGPSGTGSFLLETSGGGRQAFWQRILTTPSDSGTVTVGLPAGSGYRFRAFAIDGRTNPFSTGRVFPVGTVDSAGLVLAANATAPVRLVAKPISIQIVGVPDTVEAFSPINVRVVVTDSTGMTDELLGNRRVNWQETAWNDDGHNPNSINTDGGLVGAGRFEYSATIPGQGSTGSLFFNYRTWTNVGGPGWGNEVDLIQPSVTLGQTQRKVTIRAPQQGLNLLLRGPAGTGAFLYEVAGPAGTSGWQRALGVSGDSARVSVGLQVGTGFRLRAFAIDNRTNPAQVQGLLALGAGGRDSIAVTANTFGPLTVSLPKLGIQIVSAPDSAQVNTTARVFFDVTDSSGVALSLMGGQALQYNGNAWGRDLDHQQMPPIEARPISAVRTRFESVLPSRAGAGELWYWQAKLWTDIGTTQWWHRIALPAPSLDRGEPLRRLIFTSGVPQTTQAVAAVLIQPGSFRMTAGQSVTVRADAVDSVGGVLTGRTVTWSSSNPAVATVSPAGVVTGLTAGTVDISGTIAGVTSKVTVQVVAEATPTGVALTMKGPAGTGQFFVRVRGGALTQDTWELAPEAVGDSARIVLGLPAGGPYQVTAYAIDSRTMFVRDQMNQVQLVGVGQLRNLTVTAGSQVTARVQAAPVRIERVVAPDTVAAFTEAPVTFDIVDSTGAVALEFGNLQGVTWNGAPYSQFDYPNQRWFTRATVSAGRYRWTGTLPAQSQAGRIYWRASLHTDLGGPFGWLRMYVQSPSTIAGETLREVMVVIPLPPVAVGSVVASPGAVILEQSKSAQLVATVRDVAGGLLTGQPLTWSSSDTNAVSVSSSGLILAKASGSASVIVSTGGNADTVPVTVAGATPSLTFLVASADSVVLFPTRATTLQAEARNATGIAIGAVPMVWGSTDSSVVSVDQLGRVEALPYVGTASRSALVIVTAGGLSDTVRVRVAPVTGSSAILATLRGPAGTGSFFVEVSGGSLPSPSWNRITDVSGDSAQIELPVPIGSSYTLRTVAIDRRTSPLTINQVAVIGAGLAQGIDVVSGAKTLIRLRAAGIGRGAIEGPDSLPAYQGGTVRWVFTDTSGVLNTLLQERWVQMAPTKFLDEQHTGARGSLSVESVAPYTYRYNGVINPQTNAGTLYWQVLATQYVSGNFGNNRLSLAAPSTVRGELLRQTYITPALQGATLTLVGPDGVTGGFLLEVSGGNQPTVWQRVSAVGGDSAVVDIGLPVGSGYRVRALAIDSRTGVLPPITSNPVRVVGGADLKDINITAGSRIVSRVRLSPIVMRLLPAPDTVSVFQSRSVGIEIVDSTGVHEGLLNNRWVQYAYAPWGSDTEGRERQGLSGGLVAPALYRYEGTIPPQSAAGTLYYQFGADGCCASGNGWSLGFTVRGPALVRGESLKKLTILPASQGVSITFRGPARTKAFVYELSGPNNSGWRSVMVSEGDTARVTVGAPAGAGYRVRAFAIDERTPPTTSNWVQAIGAGQAANLTVTAGAFTAVDLRTPALAWRVVSAADTVQVNTTTRIVADLVDSSGVAVSLLGNRSVQIAPNQWFNDTEYRGREALTGGAIAPARYRFESTIPAQTTPALRYWQARLEQNLGPFVVHVFSPSLVRGESLRKLFGSTTVPRSTAPIAAVAIRPSAVRIATGQTVTLRADALDSVGVSLTGRTATWVSGDTAIVTVSASGVITAKAIGSSTVTATVEGKSAAVAVTVVSSATPTGVQATLKGISGTGSFFVRVVRPDNGESWERVTQLAGDSALASIALPAGGPYRFRVFAVDTRTNPLANSRVTVHAVGRAENVFVTEGAQTALRVVTSAPSVQNVVAADTVRAFSPIAISWDLVDTTGVTADLNDAAIFWQRNTQWSVDAGASFGNGVSAVTDLGSGRIQYRVDLPTTSEPSELYWQIIHRRGANGSWGGNELVFSRPSVSLGETLRKMVVIQAAQNLVATLKGPSGTGYFFACLSGTSINGESCQRILQVAGDSAKISIGVPAGGPLRLRVFAIDIRTNPAISQWVTMKGVGQVQNIRPVTGENTVVTVRANAVTQVISAPDSVEVYQGANVSWDVVDSSGVFADLRGTVPWGSTQWGDDRGRLWGTEASRQSGGAAVYRYSVTLGGQSNPGQLYFQVLNWADISGNWGQNYISLFTPSIDQGQTLRRITVTPAAQRIVATLKGPAGTGSFFVRTTGPGVDSWQRVTQVAGDSAKVEIGLPVGSGYRITSYAIDLRTNPLISHWVLGSGVGERRDLALVAGELKPVTVTATTISLPRIVAAPDTLAVNASATIAWEVTDSTEALESFERYAYYRNSPWNSDFDTPNGTGATRTNPSVGRYRFTASFPAPNVASTLYWNVANHRYVDGSWGNNRIAFFTPSVIRGESLRAIVIKP